MGNGVAGRTIEERKLAIDEERLKIDQAKAEREARFLNRHFPTILTSLISLVAICVSGSQVWVAYVSANNALTLQREQRQAEMTVKQEQDARDWNLRIATFVIDHDKAIFSNDPGERERMKSLLLVTFPQSISKKIFAELENSATQVDVKKTWESAKKAIANDSTPDCLVNGLIVRMDEAPHPIWESDFRVTLVSTATGSSYYAKLKIDIPGLPESQQVQIISPESHARITYHDQPYYVYVSNIQDKSVILKVAKPGAVCP